MVGFKAPFRCGGLRKRGLERAPGNAYHILIFANPDAELDDRALRILPGVGRKTKEHEPPGMFC
jgi:hypothetical protein